MTTNVSDDFMPSVSIDYDCCFDIKLKEELQKIDLKIPLVNILSSNDELRLASLKVDDVNKLIEEQEKKDFSKWYVHFSAWGTAFTVIGMLISICCCCPSCRNCLLCAL